MFSVFFISLKYRVFNKSFQLLLCYGGPTVKLQPSHYEITILYCRFNWNVIYYILVAKLIPWKVFS